MPPPTAPAAYSERLRAPVSWWLLGAVFVVSVGWAFLVAVPGMVTVVAVLVTAVLVGWWLVNLGRVRVRVDDEALYAGRAVLPLGNIGTVVALDADQTRRTLGTDADARAFLVTRPYVRRAVRVEVLDQTDPTPYWVVSSRHPEALALSLRRTGVSD